MSDRPTPTRRPSRKAWIALALAFVAATGLVTHGCDAPKPRMMGVGSIPPSPVVATPVEGPSAAHLDAFTSYGAGRGGDDSAALQNAIDQAGKLARKGASAVVHLPDLPLKSDGTEAVYAHGTPLFFGEDRVTLSGGRRRPKLSHAYAGPGIVLGYKGHKQYGMPTAAHWRDAYGLMDSTYAPAPGFRRGYRNYSPTIEIQNAPAGVAGDVAVGGSFTLSYGGQTTAAINWNDTASSVQAKLAALSTIGVGNVTCSGGPLPNVPIAYDLTDPANPLAFNLGPALTIGTQSLTGSSGATGKAALAVCGQTVHVSFQGHGFDHPMNSGGGAYLWANQRQSTWDGAYYSANWLRNQRTTGGGSGLIPLAGLTDERGSPAPMALFATANGGSSNVLNIQLKLATATGAEPTWTEAEWRFSAQVAAPPPLLRISAQVDMDAGTVEMWIGRQKVALFAQRVNLSGSGGGNLTMSGDTVPGLAGLNLRNNEASTFNILGVHGFATAANGNPLTGQDITCFGQRYERTKRYQSGTTQVFADGTAPTDNSQFVKLTGTDCAAMQFQDPVGGLVAATFPSGQSVTGYGIVMVEGSSLLQHQRVDLEDLNVAATSLYGTNVLIGSDQFANIRRVTSSGGTYGIANMLGSQTTYTLNIEDCEVSGAGEACIATSYSFGTNRNLYLAGVGRVGILNVGKALDTQGVFVAPASNNPTEAIVKGINFSDGGGGSFRDMFIDYEFGGIGRYFVFESQGKLSTYTLSNIHVGALQSGGKAVELKGPGSLYGGPSQDQPNSLVVAGFYTESQVPEGSTMFVVGANWSGSADGLIGTPYRWASGPGAFVTRHQVHGLPTTGAWSAGRHDLFNVDAANSGDPLGWRVKTSGDFAATPPVFVPVGVIP